MSTIKSAEGLSKYLVIDFTTDSFGPICSEYFALVGMNVIRVSKPLAQPGKQPDKIAFIANNLNKKCITLDYDTDEGLDILKKLIAKADVFVTNRSDDQLDCLDLDYNSAKQLNSSIVYVSLRPYAKGSPLDGYPASEMIIDAVAGVMYTTGSGNKEPLMPGPNLVDTSTCCYAAIGAAAALYDREESGEGRYIEVAQEESIVTHSRSNYEKLYGNGVMSRASGGGAPHGAFRAKGEDQWVVLSVLLDGEFQKFCDMIGKSEYGTDPEFMGRANRVKREAEVTKLIEDYTTQYTRDENMALFLEKGRLTFGAVNGFGDLIKEQDLLDAGTIQCVNDDELGELWLPAYPSVCSGFDIKAKNPLYSGVANSEVYSSVLGMSNSDIDILGSKGII